jgi:hypothetical protein
MNLAIYEFRSGPLSLNVADEASGSGAVMLCVDLEAEKAAALLPGGAPFPPAW